MRTIRAVALVLAIAVIGQLVLGADALRLGVVAHLPGSLGAQATFAERLAVELGVALSGPGVLVARYYLAPWEIGRMSLLPVVGAGGAVAFLPGDLVAWGAYALAGLELPVLGTSLYLTADLVFILPLPPGAGTLHIGPQLGVRLEF